MSTDIRVIDGEIVLGYEDFEIVEGSECLLQDVRSKLFTDLGALFYDPSYGGKVLRFIHGSRDDLTLQELKQAVKIVLKTDDRILPNSIKVTFTTTKNELIINSSFTTIENEQLETEVII